MKVENEVKITFEDVMIKPKRSTLKSRNDVSLLRKFKFRHSPLFWEGVPIIAANMDTVGTIEMAEKLSLSTNTISTWSAAEAVLLLVG